MEASKMRKQNMPLDILCAYLSIPFVFGINGWSSTSYIIMFTLTLDLHRFSSFSFYFFKKNYCYFSCMEMLKLPSWSYFAPYEKMFHRDFSFEKPSLAILGEKGEISLLLVDCLLLNWIEHVISIKKNFLFVCSQ